jgi:hypothetical protein
MKIKIKKLLKEGRFKDSAVAIMKKYDIDIGEELGRGAFGIVFSGISGKYGPVAVKMVRTYSPTGATELENYKLVGEARAKSKYIAKHFPEVYHIDEGKGTPFSFIVMEILDVQQGEQFERISMLFGGINTALKPTEDEKEVEGFLRSRGNRIYMLFKDKNSQQSIIQDFYSRMSPDLDFLIPVIKEFFSYLDAYVSNIRDNTKSKQSLSFMNISGRADTYLNNWMTGSEKALFQDSPWLLTFIIKQLEALQMHENKILFAQHHANVILYWLEYFRKSSPIGIKDGDPTAYQPDDAGIAGEQWKVFKEASSVKRAIDDLRNLAGIQAKDMHDKNVMIRPQTGDIVIVDLGLFKKT